MHLITQIIRILLSNRKALLQRDSSMRQYRDFVYEKKLKVIFNIRYQSQFRICYLLA